MSELYANYNALTTLASNYGTGVGTITVGTTGVPFPQSGTFSVVVTDQVTNASKVLFRVIAVPTGTTFVVTPEGNDGTAASGDNVYAVLSSKSIDGIRNDISEAGAFASLPAANKNGNLYLTTDYSPYIFRDNASVQQAWLAPNVTVPPLVSTLTWVNQGTLGSATNVGGILNLIITDTSALNFRLLTTAAPSTPYSFIVRYQSRQAFINSQVTGVYFYDGTKISGIESLTAGTVAGVVFDSPQAFIRVSNITNTIGSTYTPIANLNGTAGGFAAPSPAFGPIWMRLRNNGTILSYDYSIDGAFWINLATQTTSVFITPTQIGIGGVSVVGTAGFALGMSISSWYTTTTATL